MSKNFTRIFFILIALALLSPLIGVGLIWHIGWSEHTEPSDVALVLGNAVSTDGIVSERLQARLDRAAALYHDGLVKKIIASGGIDQYGTDEAQHMAEYLHATGIPPEALIVHNKGNNSYLSARFAAEGLKQGRWNSVTVVSQFYHVPRVRMAMSFFGTPAAGWARPDYIEKGDWQRIMRELAACLRYLFYEYKITNDSSYSEQNFIPAIP